MAFTLPKLQGRLPIVDSLGKPVDYFLRFLNIDFSGAIERQERRQDETDQNLQDQIDRINRILAGQENFTGIQVGGQNVKPFLDKTDGDTLVETDGLDTALVETNTIAVAAVSDETTAFTSARLDMTATPTSPNTVQTVTIVATGGRIVISSNFFLWAAVGGGSFTYTITINRIVGGVPTLVFSATSDSPPITGDDYVVGWQPVFITDTPPAATVQYVLAVSFDQTGWSDLYAEHRFLSAQEFKR